MVLSRLKEPWRRHHSTEAQPGCSTRGLLALRHCTSGRHAWFGFPTVNNKAGQRAHHCTTTIIDSHGSQALVCGLHPFGWALEISFWGGTFLLGQWAIYLGTPTLSFSCPNLSSIHTTGHHRRHVQATLTMFRPVSSDHRPAYMFSYYLTCFDGHNLQSADDGQPGVPRRDKVLLAYGVGRLGGVGYRQSCAQAMWT